MIGIECRNNSIVFAKDMEEKVFNKPSVWTVKSLMLYSESLGSGVEKHLGKIRVACCCCTECAANWLCCMVLYSKGLNNEDQLCNAIQIAMGCFVMPYKVSRISLALWQCEVERFLRLYGEF